MRLFLKEHMILIVIQIIQFITITGIFWLAGFRNIQIILYSMFLGCFLLVCYLSYYYFNRRKFYKRLSTPITTLDESLQELEHVEIANKLNELLKSQYNEFQKHMIEMSKRQEEHLIFKIGRASCREKVKM